MDSKKAVVMFMLMICMGSSNFMTLASLAQISSEVSNLSDYLWENSQELVNQAFQTRFIAGMLAGNLDPNFYGHYTLQDAVWLYRVGELWGQLSNTTAEIPETVRSNASRAHASYIRYGIEMLEDWSVTYDTLGNLGASLGEAGSTYVNTIEDVIVSQPIYTMIVTYPCLKIWPYLANKLLNETEETNIYRFWMEENNSTSSAERRANLINELYNQPMLNLETSLCLFRQGIECELIFFNLTQGVSSGKCSYSECVKVDISSSSS